MPSLDFSVIGKKLVMPLVVFFGRLALVALVILLALLVYAHMKYHFPLWIRDAYTVRRLKRMDINMKILDFIRWCVVDMCYRNHHRDWFDPEGFIMFCGRQGSGKTISMVDYANRIHKRYPDCWIVSNFKYRYATHTLESWHDFMSLRNGKRGVLFLIDEIHSEYSSSRWKDFPEELLSEVSMQRKQRIQIVSSAQVFTRVVKQLREQCSQVVQCSTVNKRWTFNKTYDAKDYELFCDSLIRTKKLKPFYKHSFIQNDFLRRCYDTYEKIERLKGMEFIPRHERINE